jgi:hypothetical protein
MIHPKSLYLESVMDDIMLHCNIDADTTERIFSRLILEEPLAYALGLRDDAPSLEELTNEIAEQRRLIDDARSKLQEILYDRKYPSARWIKPTLTKADKEALASVERSLA